MYWGILESIAGHPLGQAGRQPEAPYSQPSPFQPTPTSSSCLPSHAAEHGDGAAEGVNTVIKIMMHHAVMNNILLLLLNVMILFGIMLMAIIQ